MAFHVKQSVTVSLYRSEANSRGGRRDAWAEPATVLIYGWAPSGMEQEIDGMRRPVAWDVDVYAPAGVEGSPRAKWILNDGRTYEQVGHAEDFTHGPFGFAPGVRINLKRIEG